MGKARVTRARVVPLRPMSLPATSVDESVQRQAECERELDAVTLEQAWSIIMRAWHARRTQSSEWKLIANHVHLVGGYQEGRS
jgi:hypothetical protein